MAHGSSVTTRRSFLLALSLIAGLAILPACSSSDDGNGDSASTSTVKAYLGLWRVTNKADADDRGDIRINADGTYTVSETGSPVVKLTGKYTEVDKDNIVGSWQHVSIAGFHGRMTVSMTTKDAMDYTFIEDLSSGPKTAYFSGVRLQ